MVESLQMFLFLFKSKYRRKCSAVPPFLCSVLILLLLKQVYGKCSDQTCMNGVCENDTCMCNEGWQGPDCQYCGGKIRLVEPRGFIHDGPGNYSIGVKCSWLIDGGVNSTVRLHIQEFATECGWDHLYVYDGDSVDSPLLAVFSGLMYKDAYAVRSVPEIITRSGSALLHFFSDDAYNMSGFNISYAINACPSKYSALNCSGHGTCEHSVCRCDDGWTGKACEKSTCPGNCSYELQQGICQLTTQSCQCSPGFGGSDCSQHVKYGVWEEIESSDWKPAGTASHGAVVWKDSLYIIFGEGYGRSHLMYTYDFNGSVWEMVHSTPVITPLPRYGGSAVLHGDKIFYYGGVVSRHHTHSHNSQRHRSRHSSTSRFRDSSGHYSHALPLSTSQDGTSERLESSEKTEGPEGDGSAVTWVTDELWAFDISAKTWENITVRTEPCNNTIAMCGPLNSAGHTATVVVLPESSNHRKPTKKMIVIFGHSPQYGYLNTVQEYNFGTREWTLVQTRGYPAKGGYGHTAAYDELSEKIYVYGGIVSESESNQVLSSNLYSYDPVSKIWALLSHAPSARFLHSANFITPGLMLVFGGNTHNDTSHSFGAKCYSNELLAYDVLCDSWRHLNIPHHLRENLARYGHSGTMFEGSLHIYGGFSGQLRRELLRLRSGDCHMLTTQASCLGPKTTMKCIWDINKAQCYNVSEVSKDFLRAGDPDFDNSFYKCPEESRDSKTQKMLLHKDRCMQHDCASCVQTFPCVWCPAGVCMTNKCGANYHPSLRKTITRLEECPSDRGVACSSLHSCRACTKAGIAQLLHDTQPTAHSKTSVLPFAAPCYWDLQAAKCIPRTAVSPSNELSPEVEVELGGSGGVCGSGCWELTSCHNCTQYECIWCQNQARCVDKNAYTASFPYGQCREWTTVVARCRTPQAIDTVMVNQRSGDSCAAYASCSQCREEPACGWCDNGSRTGLGTCMPGGAARPAHNYSCPHHNWHFTHCPSCQCNGHSTCLENSPVCVQPCGNLTLGPHCDKCIPGYWGNPLNGGKCQLCECNEQATLCHPETGKCFCTTKGLAGDRCEKCDATNHYHGDPSNKGSCYYDLAIDYQFTFNLSKKEDRHFTQINFRNSPIKPDIDADFSIMCSVLAKMNITIRTANGQEKSVFHSINCTSFKYRFSKADHNFGIEDNVTLTTFYVYVYDFQPPLWIQISFSQYPKLNLQQFFITFSSCFLLLLLVAAISWKLKQRYDIFRRRQRMFVEMEQMASRPFSQVLVEIEIRETESIENCVEAKSSPVISNSNHTNTNHVAPIIPTILSRKKRDSPSPIALEPCNGSKAAVLSLLVRLPTGGGRYTPSGQPAGLAVASALVTLGSPPRPTTPAPNTHTEARLKRGKGRAHPDTCI